MSDLKPGRDLDALVEASVMGGDPLVYRPYYSTDMVWAWLIVEKYSDAAVWVQCLSRGGIDSDSTEPGYQSFCRAHGHRPKWRCKFGRDSRWGYSESAPHAICLAALEAVNA